MQKHKTSKKINLAFLPKHLGIILDGNGRWATRRGLPRIMGHKKGAETLESIVRYAFSLGIKVISVFAFSTENWKRPKNEVEGIFDILRDFINEFNKQSDEEQKNKIAENDIKIVTIGDISRLPTDLAKAIETKKQQTASCEKYILNIALNYGGRDDIVQACNKLLKSGKTIITEQDFDDALYTSGLPNLDFVIRTGGEVRISNFMLYQMAYAELYFVKTFWPDFTPKDLDKALIDYQKRNRKFGDIKG